VRAQGRNAVRAGIGSVLARPTGLELGVGLTRSLPKITVEPPPSGRGISGDWPSVGECFFSSETAACCIIHARDYKSNNTVVYSCKDHVVWCPKYRRPVWVKPVDARLKTILREVALARRCEIIALEVLPDPVHRLMEGAPQYGGHRVLREITGRSSHPVRTAFPSLATRLPPWWTHAYFGSPGGGSPLSLVQQDSENQKRSER
jgi:putative transposase